MAQEQYKISYEDEEKIRKEMRAKTNYSFAVAYKNERSVAGPKGIIGLSIYDFENTAIVFDEFDEVTLTLIGDKDNIQRTKSILEKLVTLKPLK